MTYERLAATKPSKVWFSHSHNCTFANGTVFQFCLRNLIVKWPARIVHFSLATAHDCESGLLRHLCEPLQVQTSSQNRSVLHILKLSDVTGANYSDTVHRVDREIQLVTRNISGRTTYYWKLPEKFLGNKVDLRSFYSYTCGIVIIVAVVSFVRGKNP